MRRIGVYVDVSNISMTGGHGMRYEILRALACRDNGDPQRLNVYLAFDETRAQQEPDYGLKARNFHAILRDQGFRVTVKTVNDLLMKRVVRTKNRTPIWIWQSMHSQKQNGWIRSCS